MRDFIDFLRGEGGSARLDAGFLAGSVAVLAILAGLMLGGAWPSGLGG